MGFLDKLIFETSKGEVRVRIPCLASSLFPSDDVQTMPGGRPINPNKKCPEKVFIEKRREVLQRKESKNVSE
jgi:hypothetical protein